MSMSHNIVGWERKLGSWRGVTDIIFFTLKMLLFAFLHLIINKLSDDKWNDLLRQPWWIEGSLLKDRWATRNAYCFRLAENWRGGDQGQWEWINIKSITELTSGKRLEHEGKTMILDSNLFLKSTYYFKMTSMASLPLDLHFLSHKRELLLSALWRRLKDSRRLINGSCFST